MLSIYISKNQMGAILSEFTNIYITSNYYSKQYRNSLLV